MLDKLFPTRTRWKWIGCDVKARNGVDPPTQISSIAEQLRAKSEIERNVFSFDGRMDAVNGVMEIFDRFHGVSVIRYALRVSKNTKIWLLNETMDVDTLDSDGKQRAHQWNS